MAVTLDDAHIEVKIDVEGATRDADKLDSRLKDREKKRKSDKEREEKAGRSKWGPDAKGLGSDLLHGRMPGITRFGAAGAKVAGLLAMIEGVGLLAKAGSGLPMLGPMFGGVAAGISRVKHTLGNSMAAFEDVQSMLLLRRLLDKDGKYSMSELGGDISFATGEFHKRFEAHQKLSQAEIFKEKVTGAAMGPVFMATLLPLMWEIVKAIPEELWKAIAEKIGLATGQVDRSILPEGHMDPFPTPFPVGGKVWPGGVGR